jgi:type I restriction-modification system DNA methylase subunit
MTKTIDQGKEEVAALCHYFTTNRQVFVAPGMKEAHVRQSLIDPLFEALGWDVRNNEMNAPQYREVVTEDSLDVEGQQKSPDYTFRVGTLPKFYVEAKKCSVNIGTDPGPAFQLRRYGWSAKLGLSVLTNFEELAIYDCTVRPRPSDKATHARIPYLRYDEYPDRWRELWDVFSREAVWSGAFDQYASSKRKRGTSEVDAEFLKEMEGWRLALAGNIALRNKNLSLDDLNAAVQLTIDRVVFLRMAEDRGLEPYEQLLKLCERSDIYLRFVRDLCRKADRKYNSGLFHFQKESGVSEDADQITPKLSVDDKVFIQILQSLYFAYGSPYHFGVLPVEILGTVYERFLGKVIRLTAGHHAKIEEKPEVRKAGGVYYTPAYIVEYIVKHTIGLQIEGLSPAQLSGGRLTEPFRVLDMACGSGSFLLGAYQCLLDHCLNWYVEHKPENFKKATYKDPRSGQWRLTIEERKRILTTHIFGVDIDPQAVEVSKLSLLLKVLEGETDQSLSLGQFAFGDRALPNLADNVKCGNSLIGADYFTSRLIAAREEMKRINPFQWGQGFPNAMKAGGFDSIIGNPPYLFITEVPERDRAYYQDKYKSVTYRFDLYGVFVEHALAHLLRPKGLLGFIIPHTLLSNDSFQALRSLVATQARISHLVDLGPGVFKGAKNETMLLFLENAAPVATCKTEITRTTPQAFFKREQSFIASQREWATPNGAAWLVRASTGSVAVLERMAKQSKVLSDFCTANQGLRTGDNERFLCETKKGKTWEPAAGGKEIGRYRPIPQGIFVRYEPALLDAPRRAEIFMSPEKIVVQEIRNISLHRRIVATLDLSKTFCLQSTNVVNLRPGVELGLRYLLGILNSRAVNYFFRCRFPGNNHIPSNQLLRIPIPLPPTTQIEARIAGLVDAILDLNKKPGAQSAAQKTVGQRQIDSMDAEIDQLVYDLYGLTAEEIALLEEATGGSHPT